MKLAIALLTLTQLACVGTFGEAKPPATEKASASDKARCDKIDNLQLVFGGTTLVLSAAAGSSGLVAWRVKNDGLHEALIVSAGAAALLAVGTGYIWDSKQKQWVREGCAS